MAEPKTKSRKPKDEMPDLPEADRLEGATHPRAQTRLIGQGHAESALLDAYKSGRMHHAWLLTGPKGIGKATLAYRMARFCLTYDRAEAVPPSVQGLDVDPNGHAARQVASLSHPDLLVLRRPYDEKGKRLRAAIPVEESRRLQPFFGKSAGAGGWRICVVDSADELNPNAANALLKLLEEPPQRALFLIVAHQPGRLLPTIRSRCRALSLQPLSGEAVAEVMAHEGVNLSGQEAELVAHLAEGSPGEAMRLTAGGGIELYRNLVELLQGLPDLDAEKLHGLADRAARRGADTEFEALTDLLQTFLHRLILAGSGLSLSVEAAPGESRLIGRLAHAAALDRWVEVWDKIGHSVARGEALNTDRKLVILTAFSLLEAAAAGRPLPA